MELVEQIRTLEERIAKAETWIDEFMAESNSVQENRRGQGNWSDHGHCDCRRGRRSKAVQERPPLRRLARLGAQANSLGGKSRLKGISKRGDTYLRTLLIHGAEPSGPILLAGPISAVAGFKNSWPDVATTVRRLRLRTRMPASFKCRSAATRPTR